VYLVNDTVAGKTIYIHISIAIPKKCISGHTWNTDSGASLHSEMSLTSVLHVLREYDSINIPYE